MKGIAEAVCCDTVEANRLKGIAEAATVEANAATVEANRLKGIAEGDTVEANRLKGIAEAATVEANRLKGIAEAATVEAKAATVEANRLKGIAEAATVEANRLKGMAEAATVEAKAATVEANRLLGIAVAAKELAEAKANLFSKTNATPGGGLEPAYDDVEVDIYFVDPDTTKLAGNDVVIDCPDTEVQTCVIVVTRNGDSTNFYTRLSEARRS